MTRAMADASEVVRFLVAGGANALFGFIVYSALILLGLPLALALLLATAAGVFFNFATFGGYTFRRLELRRLPRFLAVYGTLYLCNLAMIEGLRALTGLGPIAAQLACIAVIAPVMYVLLKAKVFGEIRDE
jgi:putative flippase GtrA